MAKNIILLPVDVKTPLSVPFGLYRFTAFQTFIALNKHVNKQGYNGC